jgi:hypothetical protein
MLLAGAVAMVMAARPADAAATDPCSDPVLKSASVQSTLQVQIRGVDWPSMTSTTNIAVPESWRGTSGLFGDAQQQGSSLACFMPINDYDYQAAPPDITVHAATKGHPAMVDITDIITMTDGPEASSTWYQGSWSVTKETWGYQIAFQPEQAMDTSGHGQWTVTLDAPGLNIKDPGPQPTTDDGQGALVWSFPPSVQPAKQHSKRPAANQAVPPISVALTSPWQVRMNLASDLWPTRWLSDTSWTLADGLIFDAVAVLLSWRLLRRKRGNPAAAQLPTAVISLSLLSIVGYAYYLVDDYFWHTAFSTGFWKSENILLVYAGAWIFLTGLGLRLRWVLAGSVALFIGATVIVQIDLSQAPLYAYNDYSGPPQGFGIHNLLVLLVPLLCAMTLALAGAVLWISRLWPFGKGEWQGLRDRSDTPYGRNIRVIVLVAVALLASVLILGQSAASAYYYWQHSDLWSQGAGVFTWVTGAMLSDAHWWIGDGIQWPLFFAILVAVFAVLRTMREDARGAFLGPYPSDHGDLILMAAFVAASFIGTGGLYDGIWIPIPFIAALALLTVWGLTRKLSKLDWNTVAENMRPDSRPVERESPPGSFPRSVIVAFAPLVLWSTTRKRRKSDSSTAAGSPGPDSGPGARESLLCRYQNDLLTASEQGSATPKLGKSGRRSSPGAGTTGSTTALQTVIPLASLAPAGTDPDRPPPQLRLPWAVDPGVTALALGPGDTWWDNGVAAVQRGIYLAIVPIAFDIYIMWNSGNLSLVSYPFGLQDAIGIIAEIALGWITGLFMFGVLVAYFRGVRTPLKGIVFGLITFAAFAADAGIRDALGTAPYQWFIVDGLLAIVLFATTGLLLDMATLRKHDDQGLMGAIYRIGGVRVGITYATTLVVVAVSLWQAVYLTGQTAQQRAQNVSTAAQYLNSSSGSH